MITGPLSLQIASGVLIAVAVMLSFRGALALWGRGDVSLALFILIPTTLLGGGLILAGLGLVPW